VASVLHLGSIPIVELEPQEFVGPSDITRCRQWLTIPLPIGSNESIKSFLKRPVFENMFIRNQPRSLGDSESAGPEEVASLHAQGYKGDASYENICRKSMLWGKSTGKLRSLNQMENHDSAQVASLWGQPPSRNEPY